MRAALLPLSLSVTVSLLAQSCGASTARSLGAAAGTGVVAEAPSVITNVPASNTFLYRPSPSSNKIYRSSINTTTGAISEHPAYDTGAGSGPADFAATPDGRFAYVANSGRSDISLYSLNSATGELTHVLNQATYAGPVKLAMDPAGRFLFALHSSNSQLTSFRINAGTGALTFANAVSSSGGGARAIAGDPAGKFLFAANNNYLNAYGVDQTTGELTVQGAQFALDVGAMQVNPAGAGDKLYYAHWLYSGMGSFTIAVTGLLTSLGAYTGATPYHYPSIAFDPSGAYLYAAGSYGNELEAYAVNPGTGALTFVNAQALPAGCYAKGLRVVPGPGLVYAACSDGSGKTLGFKIGAGGSLQASAVSTVATGMAASALTVVEF